MSSSRTLRRQAQAEATLRTAPQASVLREMLIQAMSDRDVAIKAATGAAHGVTAAVAKAGPSLKHVYHDAINQAHGTSATVDATLSSMGAVAGPYQAAMARERGTGADRLSQSLTSALSELSNRRIEAAAGRAQATNAALSEYSTTKAKLTRQASDLANQSGLYASTRLGELTDAERKARQQAHQQALTRHAQAVQNALGRKNSRLTAGVDAQGKVIPGGAKDKPAGAKHLSASEQRTRGEKLAQAKSQIAQAQTWINRFRNGAKPKSDKEIRQLLASGQSARSIGKDVPVMLPNGKPKTDARGQIVTRVQTIKGDPVPKLDADFIQAALELENQGHLSTATIHALRGRRIHVIQEWLTPRSPAKRQAQRRQSAAKKLNRSGQNAAQQVANAFSKLR
jgi:hypothetical protein